MTKKTTDINKRVYKIEGQIRSLKKVKAELLKRYDKLDSIFNSAERFKDLPPRHLWPLNYRIKSEPEKVDDFLDLFAGKFQLSFSDLSGPNRRAETVNARHVAMWFLKLNTPYSYKAIGAMFHRDHSTALHACRKVENLLEINDHMSKFAADIAHITALEIWPTND